MTTSTVRDLNEYVVRADTEKNEWTFSGEIWNAINELLEDREQRARAEANLRAAEICSEHFMGTYNKDVMDALEAVQHEILDDKLLSSEVK